ncbi:hypothetical protein GQ54DRAFT_261777 [Martensiomyces pterosporus]|nr:hypothetical protein GQ54DRAFT_261777 [Martensiomyces pterosporus]
MDVSADIAPLHGTAAAAAAPSEAVSGGIALGLWTSTSADMALLYRYNSRLLEIRNMAIPAPELPEALATLSTTQLQTSYGEELEISLVTSAVLNDTVHFLVYVCDAVSEAGKLYAFNPFSLAIYPIPAGLPNNICSLGVSAPFCAGSGSTTEWEFSVACFGMPGGKVLIGSLTIGQDGSQLTAIESCHLDTPESKVTKVFMQPMPGADGRVLAFLGLTTGQIIALEYSAFRTQRARIVGAISSGGSLGPVAQITALAIDERRVALCAGHNPGTQEGSAAAVSAHLVSLNSGERSEPSLHTAHIGVASFQAPHLDEDSAAQDARAKLLASASVVDMAMRDMRSSIDSAEGPQGIIVSALASAGAVTCGVLCTWSIEAQSLVLAGSVSQIATPPEQMLGMRIAGKSAQVEVVTSKHILVCDALDERFRQPPSLSCGIGLPLDASGYAGSASRFAYQPRIRSALAEQRRRMDGELFIDLLLRMAGVAGVGSASAYPPRTPAEQRTLVERIGSSDLDDLKQHCIVYYLLLDLDESAIPNSTAVAYARDMLVPRHFEYLMRGYWLMDHGQTAAGVSYLADPSVIADWAPKILRTAAASGLYREARRLLSSATAMMQPKLTAQPEESSVVMDVLLHCDLGEAFAFQRQKASIPELRHSLLAQLFAFALSPNVRRSVIDQLATLPFDDDEEVALESHCLHPDTPPHARDFLALYYVNRGRYVEAIRVFQDIAKSEASRPSNEAQRRKRAERSAMVKNLMMLLPTAQRCVVDELDSAPTADSAALLGSLQAWMSTAACQAMLSPNAPLSASKASRQLRPVVGVHGNQHGPSHALVRVLMRQMAATKPADGALRDESPTRTAATAAAQSNTLTLAASSPRSRMHVPFSGPPSTPRQNAAATAAATATTTSYSETPSRNAASSSSNAGQTPGRSVLAKAPSAADTPLINKRVPGGFPLGDSPSRSPFERARQKPLAQNQRAAANDSTDVRQARHASKSLADRRKPQQSPQSQPKAHKIAKPSKSRSTKKKSSSSTRDSAADSGKKSARGFERAASATGPTSSAPRTRKRK